jgi:hypothetical protein
MAACPRCQRPIAVSQPRCVYCGAPIDPAHLPAAPRPSPAAEAAPVAEERALVLIQAGAVSAEVLARALALPAFEAEQRRRRGGWQVHRITVPAAADEEAALLRASGLVVATLPESEVRPAAQPLVAEGGHRAPGVVELRTAEGGRRLAAADVILIVVGSIQREKQRAEFSAKRPTLSMEPAFRFHVHGRSEARPIEIDPEGFSFDDPHLASTSSLLELRTWLEPLSAIDDGFRHESPAFGVSAPVEERSDLSRALGLPPRRPNPKAPAVLDNLAQFRFYSGWRGALERRLRAAGS